MSRGVRKKKVNNNARRVLAESITPSWKNGYIQQAKRKTVEPAVVMAPPRMAGPKRVNASALRRPRRSRWSVLHLLLLLSRATVETSGAPSDIW